MVEDHVTRETLLDFEIELVDGSTIRTVGDVELYLRKLKKPLGHRGPNVRQRDARARLSQGSDDVFSNGVGSRRAASAI